MSDASGYNIDNYITIIAEVTMIIDTISAPECLLYERLYERQVGIESAFGCFSKLSNISGGNKLTLY